MSPVRSAHFLTLLISCLALGAGCGPAPSGDDDDSASGDDDDATGDDDDDATGDDDDDATGDDDDATGDDDDATGDDDDATGDDDDATGDDDDSVASFSPHQGEWVVMDAELLSDGCNIAESSDRGEPGSLMTLDGTDGARFDLTFAGGGETVSCVVDEGLDYFCSTAEETSDIPDSLGLDADVLVYIDSWGSFTSETEMSMSTSVTLYCSGSQCTLLGILMGASFPCTMEKTNNFLPAP